MPATPLFFRMCCQRLRIIPEGWCGWVEIALAVAVLGLTIMAVEWSPGVPLAWLALGGSVCLAVMYGRNHFEGTEADPYFSEARKARITKIEKMATLGQLTAGIAHELNNPLNFVSASMRPLQRNLADLQTLLQAYQQIDRQLLPEAEQARLQALEAELEPAVLLEETQALLAGMSEGASRTAEIIAGLRSFSRTDDQALMPIDLEQSLETTLVLLRNITKGRIEIQRQYHFDLPHIMGYAGPLNQVFMNILHNATQAIENRGTITLTTTATPESVTIRISDTGAGIPEAIRSRIFEPFFTTKDENKGTGLGLTISYDIIQEHRGQIEVESTPGKGTTFTLSLPRHLDQLLAAEA